MRFYRYRRRAIAAACIFTALVILFLFVEGWDGANTDWLLIVGISVILVLGLIGATLQTFAWERNRVRMGGGQAPMMGQFTSRWIVDNSADPTTDRLHDEFVGEPTDSGLTR